MPVIWKLTCNKCDLSQAAFPMSHICVALDDGTEVVCPHPGEARIAEKTTEQTWDVLAKTGRLYSRFALLCLACGDLDYYCSRDLARYVKTAAPGPHLRDSMTQGEAAEHSCKACGAQKLYCLESETGCRLALARLVGVGRPRPRCPKCAEGRLRLERHGMS